MRYVPSRRRHKIKETKFKGCKRKQIKQAVFKDFCSSFKPNKCPARKALPVSREKKRKLPTSSCYAFLRQKQRIFQHHSPVLILGGLTQLAVNYKATS